MKEYNEIRLLRNISIIPIIVYILSSLLILLIIFNLHEEQLKNEIIQLKERNINRYKQLTKKEVDKIYNIIDFVYTKSININSVDDEKYTKEYILDLIKSIQYDKNGYIFIINKDGDILVDIRKSMLGKNYIDLKIKNDRETISKIINSAKDGEKYITYNTLSYMNEVEKKDKVSYVKNFKPWGWIIGYGFYPGDVQSVIDERIEILQKENSKYFRTVIVITILITTLLSIILFLLSKKIRNIFTSYKAKIETIEKKNRRKQEIIYYQSKMAIMGELLNMISHQWRQPLTQINSITLDIYLEQKKGVLDSEFLKKNIADIENTTEYLSQTIDDFSNFFMIETKEKNFLSDIAIEGCIKIIKPSMKHVDIICEYKNNNKVHGYKTLFQQVILSILTNSIDIFNEKNIENPKVKIKSFDTKRFNVIEIYDNGGGIPNSIIDKVFDLYFSTKKKLLAV